MAMVGGNAIAMLAKLDEFWTWSGAKCRSPTDILCPRPLLTEYDKQSCCTRWYLIHLYTVLAARTVVCICIRWPSPPSINKVIKIKVGVPPRKWRLLLKGHSLGQGYLSSSPGQMLNLNITDELIFSVSLLHLSRGRHTLAFFPDLTMAVFQMQDMATALGDLLHDQVLQYFLPL